MNTALYPGTFDPVTNGHLDLVERALRLFDRVVVAVGTAGAKSPMFSLDERVAMLKDAVSALEGVEVVALDGLLVETARGVGASAILRGLRALSDFEYEFRMALMNRRLAEDIETVFLMPSESFTYIDSTVVKEVALLGGDVSSLVPASTLAALNRRKSEPSNRSTETPIR